MVYRTGFSDLGRTESHLVDEVRQSMADRPRALPPGMALDAAGHALFARVTSLPSFALARAESELLRTQKHHVLSSAGAPREIVDLQAGTATQPRPLLDNVERYVAVDRCRPVLDDAVGCLATAFPKLEVRAIVGDPAFGLAVAAHDRGPRLALLLGSALGRLDPTAARLELSRVRAAMEPEDRLLVGMDMVKDERRMRETYDDANDVYAAFARNALRRANREVGTDFRSTDWAVTVEVQPERGRVEIRLEARRDLKVDGGRTGAGWSFAAGEAIVVEHAYKPSEGQLAATAIGAGFRVEEVWKDEAHAYALFLLAP